MFYHRQGNTNDINRHVTKIQPVVTTKKQQQSVTYNNYSNFKRYWSNNTVIKSFGNTAGKICYKMHKNI